MTYDLRSDDIAFLRSIPERVQAEGMYGLADVVNALMVALLSEGHVLLEGNPGLGKTALVKALSRAVGLGDGAVGRIQFTPDLMPADITGTLMPVPSDRNRLEYQPGPIFAELLLADEINRATPKTQAAMLEGMAEFQVTVLKMKKPLQHWTSVNDGTGLQDVRTPFMVMATQNPIDQDGTFSLPEAQLDRFMFKIRMEMPAAEIIARIIGKELAPPEKPEEPGDRTDLADRRERDVALARLASAARGVMSLTLPRTVETHIVNIVLASNGAFGEVRGLSEKRMEALKTLVTKRITYPFGPRAAISLAKAALGWSAVALTEPERADEAALFASAGLAAVIRPALRHRLRIEEDYGAGAPTPAQEADALDDYVVELAREAAPDQRIGDEAAGYHDRFTAELDQALTTVKL